MKHCCYRNTFKAIGSRLHLSENSNNHFYITKNVPNILKATLMIMLNRHFVLGIGFAMIAVAFLCTVYYNVIVAWVLYYMYASMRKEVPWKYCNNEWNTNRCVQGTRKGKDIFLQISKRFFTSVLFLISEYVICKATSSIGPITFTTSEGKLNPGKLIRRTFFLK